MAKSEKTQFKPGQTGNPEGRPRHQYRIYINELKAKGYDVPTRDDYHQMINLLLAMTQSDMSDFAKDPTKPYWIRLLIADLNDKKVRQRVMSDYRDWLFGKAKQDTDITLNVSDDFKRALKKASNIDGDVDQD